MKKGLVAGLIFLLIAGSSAFLYADEGVITQSPQVNTYRSAVGEKFERGAKNILLGWTEVPKRIIGITKETKNGFLGVVVGGFEGGLKAVTRTVSGIFDVATAPIAPEKGVFVDEIDVD